MGLFFINEHRSSSKTIHSFRLILDEPFCRTAPLGFCPYPTDWRFAAAAALVDDDDDEPPKAPISMTLYRYAASPVVPGPALGRNFCCLSKVDWAISFRPSMMLRNLERPRRGRPTFFNNTVAERAAADVCWSRGSRYYQGCSSDLLVCTAGWVATRWTHVST